MYLPTRELIFEELLGIDAQRELADRLLEQVPDLKVVSVRDAGNRYVAEEGYIGLEDPGSLVTLWPIEASGGIARRRAGGNRP